MTAATIHPPAPATARAAYNPAEPVILALDRFAGRVRRRPDTTALTLDGEHQTYAELDAHASHIAAALHRRGVAPGSIVAIYTERSFALIAAMLGAWKAGCAYLPIEITSPLSRTEHILNDSGAAIILTDSGHATELSTFTCPQLQIDRLDQRQPVERGVYPVTADSLAYVIYTSGSTGTPKGVMVTHGNLASLMSGAETMFGFHAADVWTMFHSAAFDFSVWEIWGALCFGGRLVMVPFDVSRSPDDFCRLLASERVTVLNQTPTAFCMLIRAEAMLPTRQLSLRLVLLGGEALNLASLQPFYERHGSSTPQIVNMYGITETTVHVTARFLRAYDATVATDSLIGLPIPGTRIYLLNENLQPVGAGEPGEICVAGAGVSLGYLHHAGRTARRFVTLPGTGERVYRSGDMGRVRPDGELIYLGRADNQVKVNGSRVEPGEVEAVLAGCPGISQVCVIPVHHPHAGTRLVAYFVTNRMGAGQRTICAYADRHLAAYMRPAFWVQLPTMPMDANGKVDRRAMPLPTRASGATHCDNMSALEEKIAAAWQETLEYSDVGPDTNFFDAGGNALLLFALRSKLQSALAQDIPVNWMFESSTVRSFAKKITSANRVGPQQSN